MRIIYEKEGQPRSQADPYIIFANSSYYIYTTGGKGVHCYRSEKIGSGWEYLGMVLEPAGEKDFWAPCVYEENGIYYMYYSSVNSGSRDVHEEQIKVALSDSPEGPFRDPKTLLPPFSIDPHVVKSGEELFMFYSKNDYEAERAGTYIAVAKMSSPLEVSSENVVAVRPTMDEEIYKRDRFREGQHWHTLEGAFYFREGDWHYLMYSGNAWTSRYYFIGYAAVRSDETDLTKLRFEKYPDENTYCPLISENGFESGTGHNSVIRAEGQYYCIYHGRNKEESRPYDNRNARACRLTVSDGHITAERFEDRL